MAKCESYTAIRKHDRAADEEWIKKFIKEAPYGNLATVHGDQPFINMNLFVYDEETHSIYMHTAGHGRTRDNIDAADKVCFSVSKLGRLLPAKVSREFSCEYEGVVVFGSGSVITDMKFARDKIQLLTDKYFPHLKPGEDYRPITPAEIAEISAYQIKITQWSGKRKEVEADFPGAFRYEERPNL